MMAEETWFLVESDELGNLNSIYIFDTEDELAEKFKEITDIEWGDDDALEYEGPFGERYRVCHGMKEDEHRYNLY